MLVLNTIKFMIDDIEINILIKEEDTNPNRMKNPLEDFGHHCPS